MLDGAMCAAAPSRGVMSFEEFQSASYFPALDGLRAAAIGLVLFHHVRRAPVEPLYVLHENGRLGVSLFFVVSGFLITTLLLREAQANGRITLGKFYARRALRLLPLYYATLALQCVAIFGTSFYSAESRALFIEKLPAYIFYYSNWLPTATEGPFFFAWSLAVEEQFYLVFGLLMLFMSPRMLVLAVAAALAVKLLVFQIWGVAGTQSAVWRVLFSYQEPLLAGVLLGFALNVRRIYAVVACAASAWAVGLVGGLMLLWLTNAPVTAQSGWDGVGMTLLMTALVVGVVVRKTVPILCSAPCRHVGRVSYGIYLLHWFVFVALGMLLPRGWPTLFFLVGTATVIVAASISYRYFEAPLMARFRPRVVPARGGAGQAPALPGSAPVEVRLA